MAKYGREVILGKTKVGQQLAKATGKHIDCPSGVNQENYGKVKGSGKEFVRNYYVN